MIGYGLLCLLGGDRGHAVVAPAPTIPAHEPPLLLASGAVFVALGLWAAPRLLRGYGLLARLMLGPTGQAELALRVAHLAQTRAEAIDTGAAEMRRIERDLHDGAQARMVAMGMTAGPDLKVDLRPRGRPAGHGRVIDGGPGVRSTVPGSRRGRCVRGRRA